MEEKENAPLYDAPVPEVTGTGGKKKKKHTGWLIAGLAVALAAVVCVSICVIAANSGTVFSGVSVLGVDMGKLSLQQAEEAWQSHWDDVSRQPRVEITLDDEVIKTASLQELGTVVDERTAAETAWNACHSGRFFADGYRLVYSWFSSRDLTPVRMAVDEKTVRNTVEAFMDRMDFTVVDGDYALLEDGPGGAGLYLTRPRDGKLVDTAGLTRELKEKLSRGDLSPVVCDYRQQNAVTIDVQAIYDELHGTMCNAVYDRNTGGPSRSRVGVEFDVAKVRTQMETQPEGSTFRADATVEFPAVTTEELEECMFRDVLGTYTTKVTGSSVRIGNVRLASQNCNGRVYNPGEEFWYNATVGKRTVERGFGEAPAYLAGETVMEVGGGICQVSSTLYYAALLANQRIVLRYAHQFVPAYITPGCDATVSWGGPDFAFANSTAYPIKIVASWNNNNLTMTILGTKVDDTYVKMESYTRSSTPYQVEYRYNPELVNQDDVAIQTAYTGYLVETYRCVYDGNGELLSRTYEARSNYDERDAIIETGDYAKVQRIYQESLEAA